MFLSIYKKNIFTMEKNIEKALNSFVDEPVEEKKDDKTKKVILDEREGLIERIDKIIVTKDGKMLLREQY
jgi:ferritin-like metal-binding protein YciE